MRIHAQVILTLAVGFAPLGAHAIPVTPNVSTTPVQFGQHPHGIDLVTADKMLRAGEKANQRGKIAIAIRAYELSFQLGDARAAIALALLYQQNEINSSTALAYLSQAHEHGVNVEKGLRDIIKVKPDAAGVKELLGWFQVTYPAFATSRPSVI